METTTTPKMTDEQYNRLDELRRCTRTLPERLEAYAELAEDIAEDHDCEAEEFIEDFATREAVGCEVASITLPEVLEELREFTDYYDDFDPEGDDEFLEEISMGGGMDFTHQAYYALQSLYRRALREIVTPGPNEVYEAVYRRMYDLVRDPRPVLYQIAMEEEPNCLSAKDYVEDHVGIEWEMENVDDIAAVLIEGWVGMNDHDEREHYDFDRVRAERVNSNYRRDLDAIIRDVECGDCPFESDD